MKGREILCALVLAVLMASCVSLQDRAMTSKDLSEMEVLGKVNVKFQSWQPLHIYFSSSIKNRAYNKLLKEAQKQYAGIVDVDLLEIRNINMKGVISPLNLIYPTTGFLMANWQTIRATGDVVINRTGIQTGSQAVFTGLNGAINRAGMTLLERLPKDSRIAVLSISADNQDDSAFVIEELEFIFVNNGSLRIVDRKNLSQIRAEQKFQISGDVSDESAVSIGNMLGASIVITGSITGSRNNQRLTIKALDVRTAQIITMAREQF